MQVTIEDHILVFNLNLSHTVLTSNDSKSKFPALIDDFD